MSQKLTQSLDLRQQQNLVMTPQMQQAIKLLQLNNLELQDFLEEELAQNPLLEKAEQPNEAADAVTDADNAPAEDSDNIQDSFDDNNWDNDKASGDTPQDFDAGSAMATVGAGGSTDFSGNDGGFEDTLTQTKTLRDHLLDQLKLDAEDTRDLMMGALLIDRLDEAGYLRDDPTSLAAQLGCSQDRLNSLLTNLKTFDPPGVFAGNLAECLALQLADRGTLDAPMQKLLANLDLVAKHELKKLAVLCDVHETALPEMLAELRTLNPKPSAPFEHVVVQTAIPDVLMKALPKDVGGGWRVELNTDTLPRVLVNQQYYTDVQAKAKDKQEREYLTTQLNNANWLVKALDQRAQTILKVASQIVEEQDGFFLYGVEFLKPLTLREIAEAIAMHESTVSRVTTGKFIGTPRGLFELKYFFSSTIEGTDGSALSSEAVRAKIKNLIDAETADDILSDDDLVDLLRKDGVDIARRTIAKYREAMNIGSSVQRRRQKKSGL